MVEHKLCYLENMLKLHAVAKALLEKEKLDSEEFEELFKNS